MDVEFCEDNSGSAQKMGYFRKTRGGSPIFYLLIPSSACHPEKKHNLF